MSEVSPETFFKTTEKRGVTSQKFNICEIMGWLSNSERPRWKKSPLPRISLFMGINSTASRRVSSTSADTTFLDLDNGGKTLRHVAMVAIFLDLNNPRSRKYGRKKMHVWLSCAWLHSGTKRKPILFFQHLTSLSRKIRELKQRRRRRRREGQKINRFRLTRQQLSTCSTLIGHFLAVVADYDLSLPEFHVLLRTWTQHNNFLLFFCPLKSTPAKFPNSKQIVWN